MGTLHMGFFPTTHWSVVLTASQDDDAEESSRALAELYRSYRYPLYCFSRSLGDSPHDAEDLTQAYFTHLIRSRLATRVTPTRGLFRSFLLISFRNFRSVQLRHARAQKRGGTQHVISWDGLSPEERFAMEPQESMPPEKRFDRNWAIAVVSQARNLLEKEYAEGGKCGLFARIAVFLPGRDDADGYNAIAMECGKSVAAVKMEVSRMRKRYLELLHFVVGQTVSRIDDVASELRYLLQVLATP